MVVILSNQIWEVICYNIIMIVKNYYTNVIVFNTFNVLNISEGKKGFLRPWSDEGPWNQSVLEMEGMVVLILGYRQFYSEA